MRVLRIATASIAAITLLGAAAPAFARGDFGEGKQNRRDLLEHAWKQSQTESGSTMWNRGRWNKNEDKDSNGKNVDAACMQPAVAARETALQAEFSALSASISSALTTRASALNTAWGLTDASARQTAVKKAWATFQDSVKAARKTAKDAKKAAWKTYKDATKTCGGAGQDEGEGEMGMDDLGL